MFWMRTLILYIIKKISLHNCGSIFLKVNSYFCLISWTICLTGEVTFSSGSPSFRIHNNKKRAEKVNITSLF